MTKKKTSEDNPEDGAVFRAYADPPVSDGEATFKANTEPDNTEPPVKE
jgi:hypothetical protein